MTPGASRDDAALDVVIAEDSRTQAERLRYFLSRNGFSVRGAGNGAEALALVAEKRPAVVVSDIVMPEVDGYDLCRSIRRDPALADLPVILLTALTGATDVIDGLASGATDFLLKPYTEEALVTSCSVGQVSGFAYWAGGPTCRRAVSRTVRGGVVRRGPLYASLRPHPERRLPAFVVRRRDGAQR